MKKKKKNTNIVMLIFVQRDARYENKLHDSGTFCRFTSSDLIFPIIAWDRKNASSCCHTSALWSTIFGRRGSVLHISDGKELWHIFCLWWWYFAKCTTNMLQNAGRWCILLQILGGPKISFCYCRYSFAIYQLIIHFQVVEKLFLC